MKSRRILSGLAGIALLGALIFVGCNTGGGGGGGGDAPRTGSVKVVSIDVLYPEIPWEIGSIVLTNKERTWTTANDKGLLGSGFNGIPKPNETLEWIINGLAPGIYKIVVSDIDKNGKELTSKEFEVIGGGQKTVRIYCNDDDEVYSIDVP